MLKRNKNDKYDYKNVYTEIYRPIIFVEIVAKSKHSYRKT